MGQSLRDYPDVSIGPRMPMIGEYFSRLGECDFCLAPKGLGYWSNRLYEVIHAGCLPVIISDEVHLPFPDLIPWESFTVKWPTATADHRLLEHLRTFPPDRVTRMRAALRKARCWLSWHGDECSAPQAIVRALARKLAGRPPRLSARWG